MTMSLKAALKIVKEAGIQVSSPLIALNKDEVSRINEALIKNEGRVFVTHNGRRMKLFTTKGYQAMLESAAHMRKHRKPAAVATPS